MEYDAAIFGAGIAGSALAKSMADRGWRTLLLDRKSFPRHKVCGEFLSPESQSMLQSLGVYELVESLQPCRIQQARLFSSGGAAVEIPLPGDALGVSRYRLDEALHQAAQSSGVHLRTSTVVTSVAATESGGYAIGAMQGREPRQYSARAVIAAWGANGHAGVDSKAERSTRGSVLLGVKSHYKGIQTDAAVELYFFEGGYLGLSPAEDGTVNAAALLQKRAFRPVPRTVQEWIEAACLRHPQLDQKMAHAAAVPGTQAAVAPVPVHRRQAAWNGLPRIGDASLMIPPLCGDGMAMALRAAELCAPLADQFLQGRLTMAQWENQYAQAANRHFHRPLLWGRMLQRLFAVPALSHLMLKTANYTPRLAGHIVRATRLKQTGTGVCSCDS